MGRPVASIKRSLWRPLCLHSATTATLKPPWQWLCSQSAPFVRSFVPLQQLWLFKEDTRVVLQQLHRNRTFWVWATTECPNNFSGRSKVARRSQSCVKGGLVAIFAVEIARYGNISYICGWLGRARRLWKILDSHLPLRYDSFGGLQWTVNESNGACPSFP